MAKERRFVIGDIHGCVKTLRELVTNKIKLQKNDLLFLLGDYIDRGPDSKGVLDFLMELKGEGYNVHPLLGNHEYMMLLSAEDVEEFIYWKKNGSLQTLMSFGIDEKSANEFACMKQVPQKYFDFLKGLEYYESTDDYYFVHAGFAKGIEKPTDDMETLLWSRSEHYNRQVLKGRILIHGHTPVSLVSIKDRVMDGEARIINLDGGCVYPHLQGFGYLVAFNLDTFELTYQKNMDQ